VLLGVRELSFVICSGATYILSPRGCSIALENFTAPMVCTHKANEFYLGLLADLCVQCISMK